jgi:hypothetical protein
MCIGVGQGIAMVIERVYASSANCKELKHVCTDGESRERQVRCRDVARGARVPGEIDADIKIEPKDWMPEEYRKTLIRPDVAARALGDHRDAAQRATGSPRRRR